MTLTYVFANTDFQEFGGNNHQHYFCSLQNIIAFMQIKSLRSLYTLTAHTYDDDDNFEPIDFDLWKGTSNVTTLVLDEAELPPQDVLGLLSIPKALETFRLSQSDGLFGGRKCSVSSNKALGQALRAHKDTLKELAISNHQDHHNDAHRRESAYGNEPGSMSCSFAPHESLLIGSLKDYPVLETLVIDASSICGHQKFSPVPFRMIEMLPSSLQSLTLCVQFHRPGKNQPASIDNTIWQDHLGDVIRRAPDELPKLEKIGIVCTSRSYCFYSDDEKMEEVEYESLFEDIKNLCVGAKLDFELSANWKGTTQIPCFKEESADRKPGYKWPDGW